MSRKTALYLDSRRPLFHFWPICDKVKAEFYSKAGDPLNRYNAFDAGVEFGGLKNSADIKILICYLLKSIGRPLTRKNMIDAITGNGIANYFEVNQGLSDLVKTECLTSSGTLEDQTFTLTARGREVAETLESTLSINVRKKAVRETLALLTRLRRESENKIEIRALESGGYSVSFTVLDGVDKLMTLELYVADLFQAEQLKNSFLEDPAGLYTMILSRLAGEHAVGEQREE